MSDTRNQRDCARRRGDDGFVVVWTSLLLVVLMLMAAFAVDVGSWYSRAAQVQRAADAAALAGVVHMPGNFSAAERDARAEARRNGFRHGTGGITVDVQPHPTSARKLIVEVIDAHVPAYFGRVVRNEISIRRRAIAEYTQPILLGSPHNYLGSGNLTEANRWSSPAPPAAERKPQNFWLSVNGYCTAKEEGDLLLAKYDGNSNPLGCGPEAPTSYSEPNQDYNAGGYVYAVVMPPVRTRAHVIQFYDMAYCPDATKAIDVKLNATGTQVTTYLRVRAPDTNGTPFNLADDAEIWSGMVTSAACNTYAGKWRDPSGGQLAIASGAPSGRYHVEVWTQPEPQSFGFNNFAIRVARKSNGTGGGNNNPRCDVRYDASCPQVSAETAMSIYASAPGETASFYLAQIGGGYAGRAMAIGLWDPGEGGRRIRIHNPDAGNAAWPFTWRTPPPDTLSPGWTGTTALDVSGTGPQPGPNRYGTGRYNDRMVQMVAQLPAGYVASGGGWWRISYEFGTSNVTDRTTWMVRVIGDPVHLARE